MTDDQQLPTDKYCVFRCCGESWAVPALSLRSVIPARQLSPLPLSHECLAGLANVHKEIVPVFDLHSLIGVASERESRQMLIMESDSGSWGILIEQVEGLESLEVSCNGSRSGETGWHAATVGSASFEDQFVTVLGPEALLQLLDCRLRDHWDGIGSHPAGDLPDVMAPA